MPCVRETHRLFLLLLLVGLALRLIWLVIAQGPIDGSFDAAEASRIANAFASDRGIADGYYDGYGPTAHLMPVTPVIAGSILWLLGPGTAASNVVLLAWSLMQVGLAYLLLVALFRSLGAEAVVIRWSLALLCLITPFARQETVDFRYWEGAAALCLAAANLLLLSRLDRQAEPNWRDMSVVAVVFAITFFVCPPVGAATGLCWSVFALTRLSLRRASQLALLTVCALALVITPWAIRNQRALGEPVLLRSNFGIELAIANHPGALSNRAPQLDFADRLTQVHPYQASATPPFKVLPGHEVGYSRQLANETWRWIVANPEDFVILSLRHLREFFFPAPWQMYFSGSGEMREARAITISLINLLGLIGLGAGLHRRRRGYWMLATYIGAISLPFALFQPTARYIYLAYGVLACLAVEVVILGGQALLRRLNEQRRASPADARTGVPQQA